LLAVSSPCPYPGRVIVTVPLSLAVAGWLVLFPTFTVTDAPFASFPKLKVTVKLSLSPGIVPENSFCVAFFGGGGSVKSRAPVYPVVVDFLEHL